MARRGKAAGCGQKRCPQVVRSFEFRLERPGHPAHKGLVGKSVFQVLLAK
jgi:hypothetical protein